MPKIARYYDESKNPRQGYFPGVPLRNIEEEEWERLTDSQRRSADASDFYRKTPVRAEKAETKETDDG